jgi:very-short-patch-repair endonuclease
MSSRHEGRCWPCILAQRRVGLAVRCTRKQGFCQSNEQCKSCFERSFATYERSLFWSKNNKKLPSEIAPMSSKVWSFSCDMCCHEFPTAVSNVSLGKWCPYCTGKKRCLSRSCVFCYFKTAMACYHSREYWSSKNPVTAREVALKSNTDYLYDCDKCRHEFSMRQDHVAEGHWCPYCDNMKRCTAEDCRHCFNHSVADLLHQDIAWSSKNTCTARSVARHGNGDCWIYCKLCKHDFQVSPANLAKGSGCSYCSNQTRCGKLECRMCFNNSIASNSRAYNGWSSRNPIPAHHVARCANDIYLFNCDNCKQEFPASPQNVTAGKWCPFCRNKTERKLMEWLQSLTLPMTKNACFDWCRSPSTQKYLPFDFYLASFKIIIELDGAQHFRQVSNWKCYENTQQSDVYKMTRAAEEGITVIRLLQEDVWSDRYDWKVVLLSHLARYDVPSRILLDNGTGLYQQHGYDVRTLVAGAI